MGIPAGKLMGSLAVLFSLAIAIAADPVQDAFDRAVASLAAGDYAAAEQGFQAVLKIKPDNAGALGNLGVVYSHTRRYGKAIEVYTKALETSPEDPNLLLNLSLVYVQQERYEDARPLLAKLLKLTPSDRQARQLQATCEVYTGSFYTALESLQALHSADPSNTRVLQLLALDYYRLQQPGKALDLFPEMQRATSRAQANLLMGKAQYEAGRFEEAARSFREALRAQPGIPTGHRELGKALIGLHRDADAERELNAALHDDREDAEAFFFLGKAELQENQLDEAAANLEAAQQRLPDYWAIFYDLGRLHQRQKEPADAVAMFFRAAQLNPKRAAVYEALGAALRGAGHESEARTALQRAKELKSQPSTATPAPNPR
jgi:protein O-GlcNAc transferase